MINDMLIIALFLLPYFELHIHRMITKSLRWNFDGIYIFYGFVVEKCITDEF